MPSIFKRVSTRHRAEGAWSSSSCGIWGFHLFRAYFGLCDVVWFSVWFYVLFCFQMVCFDWSFRAVSPNTKYSRYDNAGSAVGIARLFCLDGGNPLSPPKKTKQTDAQLKEPDHALVKNLGATGLKTSTAYSSKTQLLRERSALVAQISIPSNTTSTRFSPDVANKRFTDRSRGILIFLSLYFLRTAITRSNDQGGG